MGGFRTHTGEVVIGPRLQSALDAVANQWAALCHAIREEDYYASHVTEAEKDDFLVRGLEFAEAIRRDGANDFTTWQRVNAKLTGECIALLAPPPPPSCQDSGKD